MPNVTSVQELLDELAKTGMATRPHTHIRAWFRGQKDASWPLQPGIYRSHIPAPTEDERLTLERHLTQDFQIESAGLLTGRETRAELYFLQQHYGLPTRLLDWTHRPLTALYFAAFDDTVDGAVFTIDAYDLSVTQGTPRFRGAVTSRHSVFTNEIDAIFDWTSTDALPFILPVRPDHFDRRIAYQQSCFTFHSRDHKSLTHAHSRNLQTFIIPKSAKTRIREQLFLLGLDTFAIFGDLPSLTERLKAGHRIPV